MSFSPKSFVRKDSDFLSRGVRCAGWLYIPEKVTNPPVVVMGHGLAAERVFGLPDFAERFAEEGMAVFVFDYRNFGDSEGQPRNLVNPSRHLQDWQGALAHVRSLSELDQGRIALWGSSFSGGHVIVTAAGDPGVAAIVSQVPFVDGMDFSRRMGLNYMLQATGAGLKDLLRMVTFSGRHMVPVVGDPDSFAVLNTLDSKPGYMALIPKDSKWKNECPAFFLLSGALYRPTVYAKKIRCPALIMPAEKDTIVSLDAVTKAASKMSNARVVSLPIGHFDIYAGDYFEQAVKTQSAFLKQHLKVRSA